jgi:hypothetical protein
MVGASHGTLLRVRRASPALVVAASLFACPPMVAPVRPAAEPSESASESESESRAPPVATTAASAAASPLPSGAVSTPVFSTDPCDADEDCAPVATCHADRCIEKSKAGAMLPGTMCTEICTPSTLDCGFNHCGCVERRSGAAKVCAVLPGPRR